MAYFAALVSIVQLLEDIVHRDRYQNLLLDKQQIESLYEKFSRLQVLLDDCSSNDREEAAFPERRIRDAAYQAQDIIESHILNQVKLKTNGPFQPQRFKELRFDNVGKAYQDLEKLKEQVVSIEEELLGIKRRQTAEDLQLSYYSTNPGTSNQALCRTNIMEGVEKHSTVIQDQLCGGLSKLEVVSIVGMGGIGKTTLAKHIFHDPHVESHFDCHAWVTVSQNYHLKNVFLDILDSMNVPTNKSSEAVRLGVNIYKHLIGRRYLIIIDDIWETKVWDGIKGIFPNDLNGSRIIITTRISDVASYAGTFGLAHQMQFLNNAESWKLFREKVSCPPELENIGRLITENCRGLPLAIVVIAGLLSKANNKRSDWEEIARNVNSAVEDDEHFKKILSLSYNNLPHHLKPLFLYIAGFSKNYEIPVSRLVKLWMAERFLKPIESKSLEEVAEEYLEDLVRRNLVLITKKTFTGKIKYCNIHDVLRDLCMEIIFSENFFHVLHKDSSFYSKAERDVRRLFIAHYLPSRLLFGEAEEFGSHVRSIISDNLIWELLFLKSGFNMLAVLDATTGHLSRFSTKIFELFHLRYLAFTEFNVLDIPPSISLLQNLETLIIKPDSWGIRFCSLPSQIREMPNLRHIMSTWKLHFLCEFLDERIAGKTYILENLQMLSWANNVRFTNKVTAMIPNLQKLKVSYYEEKDVDIWQKFRLNNLSHLCQLESLNIFFLTSFNHTLNPLPESFAFPSTLKKLSLRHCRVPWKDMTVVGSLPNLQVLKLEVDAFVGEKWEPIEDEFRQLKFLLIERLGLMYWQAEKNHFPKLQHLIIRSCWKLQEIPAEIGEILTLERIEVHCSNFAANSALEIQEIQRDMGNNVLEVHVFHDM